MYVGADKRWSDIRSKQPPPHVTLQPELTVYFPFVFFSLSFRIFEIFLQVRFKSWIISDHVHDFQETLHNITWLFILLFSVSVCFLTLTTLETFDIFVEC
jgi:hypothetical protein